jgi:hypothetical protein
VYIFSARALASCRWHPLSSNVMPQNIQANTPPLINIRNSRVVVLAGGLLVGKRKNPALAGNRITVSGEWLNRVGRKSATPANSSLAASRPSGKFGASAADDQSFRGSVSPCVGVNQRLHSSPSQLLSPACTRQLQLQRRRSHWRSQQPNHAQGRGLPVTTSSAVGEHRLAPPCWLRHNNSLEPTSSGRALGPDGASLFYFAPSGPSALPAGSAQLER